MHRTAEEPAGRALRRTERSNDAAAGNGSVTSAYRETPNDTEEREISDRERFSGGITANRTNGGSQRVYRGSAVGHPVVKVFGKNTKIETAIGPMFRSVPVVRTRCRCPDSGSATDHSVSAIPCE